MTAETARLCADMIADITRQAREMSAAHWALADAVGGRSCSRCRVSLNIDDARWCGPATKLCRECKAAS